MAMESGYRKGAREVGEGVQECEVWGGEMGEEGLGGRSGIGEGGRVR